MAVERTGVYPGTFDPITSGHMEVVRRSLRLVDKLVIGPAMNISKGPMFSLEERIDIIKDDISDFPQADRDRIDPLDSLRPVTDAATVAPPAHPSASSSRAHASR